MPKHVRHAKLPEIKVPGQRLGRHIVHDQRSHDYEAERASKIISVVHAAKALPLDQGNVGSCTAEALTGAWDSAPNLKDGVAPKVQRDAYQLYGLETKNEGQPWPPNDPGGSGLEVCKAAKQMGWIKSYKHAFGIQHALEALVQRPVIAGVAWYDSFDQPDKNGLVAIGHNAQVRGGHEILADEIVAEHELIGFWNSWGPQYGLGGRFYMTFATFEALLEQQGDVTVPIA